jgi:clan AA aspartic protease
MGETWIPVVLENARTGARTEELLALADTGATLTMIPGAALRQIGVRPASRIGVRFADGRRGEREVGDAIVEINGEGTPCRVIFGETGDGVLLGLTVLEQLGLAVDPVQRRLIPAEFLLY